MKSICFQFSSLFACKLWHFLTGFQELNHSWRDKSNSKAVQSFLQPWNSRVNISHLIKNHLWSNYTEWFHRISMLFRVFNPEHSCCLVGVIGNQGPMTPKEITARHFNGNEAQVKGAAVFGGSDQQQSILSPSSSPGPPLTTVSSLLPTTDTSMIQGTTKQNCFSLLQISCFQCPEL